MFDMLTVAAVVLGFALVIVAVSKLGGGSAQSLSGMLAYEAIPARPRGVQEDDLPRFVFHDTPWRGPSTSPVAAPATGRLVGTSAA